jgi:hypothetical protein
MVEVRPGELTELRIWWGSGEVRERGHLRAWWGCPVGFVSVGVRERGLVGLWSVGVANGVKLICGRKCLIGRSNGKRWVHS